MDDKILALLKKEKGHVSGEDMSLSLGLSRSAVWKHVEQLRQKGYRIEASSRKGYRLVSVPDKPLPEIVQAGLATKTFGRKIIYLEEADSTMNVASSLAAQGAAEGTLVCAETQIKGRGRLGRTWLSPKGKGIYFSVILRPRVALAQVSCLTLVFAVAVCQALRCITKTDVRIKWPNDILIGSKKIAGILTELNAELDRIRFVVLGVGLNVSGKVACSLKEATTLDEATGQKISRVLLLQEILKQMEYYNQLFMTQGFAPVADVWRSLSATLHHPVKMVEANKTTEGVAVDIDEQGALLIKEKQGTIVRKISGDIIHLRPS